MQRVLATTAGVSMRRATRRALATKSFSVSVAQLIGERARKFESVSPSSSVLAAVEQMSSSNVGSLIVLDEGHLAGIVTERDVLDNVHRLASSSSPLYVSNIMTRNLVTVDASATVGHCLTLMTDEHNRFRHLPVTDAGELVGVLSIRDLCESLTRDHKDEVAELSSQVSKLAAVLGASLQQRPACRSWAARVRDMFYRPSAQTL